MFIYVVSYTYISQIIQFWILIEKRNEKDNLKTRWLKISHYLYLRKLFSEIWRTGKSSKRTLRQ